MTSTRLQRISFSLVLSLIAVGSFAQQTQPSAPGVGSPSAQKDQAISSNPAPQSPPVVAVQPEKQGEDATVMAQPDHRIRVHLDTVSIGAGYAHYSGPAILPLYSFYGPWAYRYWGLYSPLWWDPWLYAYVPYSGFGPGNGKGEVRLQVEPRTAEVLIDGAYAGTVAGLKSSVWIAPGAYDFCLKSPGHADYCRRIYVLSGKKLDFLAKLAPVSPEAKP